MTDLRKELNPSQYDVVTNTEGPVLVIAGAGSGKTRVIEYRVLNLVRNKVSPQSILLLTFTRRAAQQMLSRAARHDIRCSYVEGGTFHSFAYQILKKHSKLIGFESFSILDEDDSQEAINLCVKNSGQLQKDKRFPKKDTLRKIISMSINKNISVEEVLDREYPDYLDYAPDIEKIKNDYIRYKIDKGYFDYDDLLIYLKLLLQKNLNLRIELSQRFRYIMVDEYQDTNKLQADITYLLGETHKNIMVVGDDAQSIYGFRGASHENIMDFPKHFPESKIIKLEANYRSHQQILDVANVVLKNMKNKFSKFLVSAAKKIGEKPYLMFFRDAYEEAEWLAEKIKEFRNQGIELCHQAVLFRSAYISIPLQVELTKRNIPFQVFGGLKFYETAHVKDVLVHLKIVSNPRDELSWSRVLMLLEGIGEKTSEKILKQIKLSSGMKTIIQELLKNESKERKSAKPMARLCRLLEKISQDKLDTRQQFEAVLDYYHPMMMEKFDDWQQRDNDLAALKQISKRAASLRDFLAEFTLEPPERGVARVDARAKTSEKPLNLSTIHSAKGMEWECVFLIGLIDGVLPVSFSLNDEDGIEEEQRLFYVGLTRAKKHLFLSVHHEASGFGLNQFNRISRFLDSPDVMSRLQQSVGPESQQDWP